MSGKGIAAVLTEHLWKLRSACGFFQREMKGTIAEAENKLKEGDIKAALKPFVQAMEQPKVFELVVITAFCELFKACSDSNFLSATVTDLIVGVVFEKAAYSDENVCRMVAVFSKLCLESASGQMFCHGKTLKRVMVVLLRSYDACKDKSVQVEIMGICRSVVNGYVEAYEKPWFVPKTESVQSLAALVTKQIVSYAVVVHVALDHVLGEGDFSPSLKDVDLCIVFRSLCDVEKAKDFKAEGKELATKLMTEILMIKSAFFKTNTFVSLLKDDIHACLLHLILKSSFVSPLSIAKLIVVLWKRFVPMYPEQFGAEVSKELFGTLMSTKKGVSQKALAICLYLMEWPQFWVDMYVNCDCDPSGTCGSVFENYVGALTKLGMEGGHASTFRSLALKTLVKLLGGMWQYLCTAGRDAVAPDHEKRVNEEIKDKIGAGTIVDDDSAIAKFLFDNDSIDGNQRALYLSKTERVGVLGKFFELFSFKGLSFQQSFRRMISKCCVFNEQSGVDVILEAFSRRYCEENPSVGFSQEAIYVLSFSTLLLTFSVQHGGCARMSFDEYAEQNSTEVSGEAFPAKYLHEIYDDITTDPPTCGSIDAVLRSSFLSCDKRGYLFLAKCNASIENACEVMKNGGQFVRIVSPYLIRPMFILISDKILDVVTNAYRESSSAEAREIVDECLNCLKLAVRIGSHTFVGEPLQRLMKSFVQFTGLDSAQLDHADHRCVPCIESFLEVAVDDSNVLSEFWDILLPPVSALDKIKSSLNVTTDALDRVFQRSRDFHPETIVRFVRSVCRVSLTELSEKPPRFYMAKKLGMIMKHNITRPHAIIMRIWKEIGRYLCNISSSMNHEIMSFGIDMMRQFTVELLTKDSSLEFHFEKIFMMTFLSAFQDQLLESSQSYLLSALQKLVNEAGAKIRSGWSQIFQILAIATIDSNTSGPAFELVSLIITQHLPIMGNAIEGLIEVIASFAKNAQMPEAPRCFDAIASVLEPSSCQWATLFSSLARSCEGRSVDVCRVSQDVLVSVLQKAITKAVSCESMRILFIELLPKMYVTSPATFFANLIHNAIVPNCQRIDSYIDVIIEAIGRAILFDNDDLAKTAMEISIELLENYQHPFRDLGCKAYITMIETIASNCSNASIRTATMFIGTIENYSQLLGDTQICPRAVKLIEKSIRVQNKADISKRNVICAASRSLLNTWMRANRPSADDLATNIAGTISLFVDSGYLQSEESDGGQAWKDAICGSLEILNSLDAPKFSQVFKSVSRLLVQLILASSTDIRLEVGALLERQLVSKVNV